MYTLARDHRTPAGAFIRRRDGLIGEKAGDLQRFWDLRRACLVTVLDPNPSPLLDDHERDLNAGHWMLTSENATIIGHGIHRDGYTGTSMGSRFPFARWACPWWIIPSAPTSGAARSRLLPTSGSRPSAPQRSMPSTPTRPTSRSGAATAWARLGTAIDWLGPHR